MEICFSRLGPMKIWGGPNQHSFVFWLSMFSGLFPEKEKGEKVTYVVHIQYINMILCWSNDEVVLSSAIVYLQVDYVHYPRCIRHDLVIFPKKQS